MKKESDILSLAAKSFVDMTGLPCETRHVGLSFWRKPESRCDGFALIGKGAQSIDEPYVVRRALGPDTLRLLSVLRRDNPTGLLLITSHVSDQKAEWLKSKDIHFFDMDGNVFLKGDGIHVRIAGRRNKRKVLNSKRVSPSRAFYPGGLRLLFHLLTDAALDSGKPGAALVDKTYREICAATGISHSTVGWVMADLIQQRFVIQVSPGHRMLADRSRILERWVQGYTERLRPGLVVERYRPARADWWQSAELSDGLWSGETAAAFLTQSLKPQTATVFGGRPSHGFVLKHLLQKDPDGTVEFLKPFWRTPQAPAGGDPCVHPLLVYADLLSIDDDRTREVAQIIYDRYLRTIIEIA